MLCEDTVLDASCIGEIVRRGYTRIPVYKENDRNHIITLLFVKDLALLNPDDRFTVKTVCEWNRHKLRLVDDDTSLHSMLEEFKMGEYHLAVVQCAIDGEVLGIITLEDIVEEILQAEIIDETDIVIDNKYRAKRKFNGVSQLRKIREFDQKCKYISQSMAKVAIQWIQGIHEIFNPSVIDPRAMANLVHKNVHKVRCSSEAAKQLSIADRHWQLEVWGSQQRQLAD